MCVIIYRSKQITRTVGHQENWIDVRLKVVRIVFGVYENIHRSPAGARERPQVSEGLLRLEVLDVRNPVDPEDRLR